MSCFGLDSKSESDLRVVLAQDLIDKLKGLGIEGQKRSLYLCSNCRKELKNYTLSESELNRLNQMESQELSSESSQHVSTPGSTSASQYSDQTCDNPLSSLLDVSPVKRK